MQLTNKYLQEILRELYSNRFNIEDQAGNKLLIVEYEVIEVIFEKYGIKLEENEIHD
jgi:hypothetical protein